MYDNLSLLILLLSFFWPAATNKQIFNLRVSPGGLSLRSVLATTSFALRPLTQEYEAGEKLCFLAVSKAWLYKVSKNVEMLTNLQANTFYYSVFKKF